MPGLVATVDATHGECQLDRHMEAVKQAAMADRLVVTKTDLASAAVRARLVARLGALAPAASVFDATCEAGPGPDELFAASPFSAEAKSAEVRRWLRDEALPHDHAHDGDRHDDRISTFCLTAQAPLDWGAFLAWLELLLASRGEQLLRVKGLLNVAGWRKPIVIHGVQHVFYPPAELGEWPDGERCSRIVFITRDLPRNGVEKSFREMVERASASRGDC